MNKFHLGIDLPICMTHGVWSKVVLAREIAKLFGYEGVKVSMEKTIPNTKEEKYLAYISMYSYFSFKGISTKSKWLVASLKCIIFCVSHPPFFVPIFRVSNEVNVRHYDSVLISEIFLADKGYKHWLMSMNHHRGPK